MKTHLKDLYNYLLEQKCRDVCAYDLSKEDQNCDYIFVATVKDAIFNKEIGLTIMKDFELQEFPEGYHKGEWIVFDFGQCVVHLFVKTAREKYNLDKLWQSKKIKFE